MKRKTDRELLELAAKAAGYQLHVWGTKGAENVARIDLPNNPRWNPLTDDGDALRLAVKLEILVLTARGFAVANATDAGGTCERILSDSDPYAATRRAIVCAAAAIGETME
jgi:hypothetical protein